MVSMMSSGQSFKRDNFILNAAIFYYWPVLAQPPVEEQQQFMSYGLMHFIYLDFGTAFLEMKSLGSGHEMQIKQMSTVPVWPTLAWT